MPTFRIIVYGVDTGDIITAHTYDEAYRTAIASHPLTSTGEIVLKKIQHVPGE